MGYGCWIPNSCATDAAWTRLRSFSFTGGRRTWFAVTAIGLKNGAEPGWGHGLAALRIGHGVGYGHRAIRRLDGHAAHRPAGGPPPPKPPRSGTARARHEARPWLRTALAAAVARALLGAAGGHGPIALTYPIRPKEAPARAGGDGVSKGSGVSAPRPVPRARRRRPCWPCGRG